MRIPVFLLCFACLLTAAAQEPNAIESFIAETAIAEETRVDAIKAYLLDRIPDFDPPSSVEAWEKSANTLRARYRDELVLRGVPEVWRSHTVKVEFTEDIETPYGYRIRKLRYEALPSFWVPALLYEPDVVEGRVPAILNVNGHVGAPGKASEYEQIRCINLAKRGMLALHPEWLACGELDTADYAHGRLAYLDLVGVSGLSVFHYLLERALDVLMVDPRTDPDRVAMTGLSGGGWQTTVFSAIDERIRVIAPNAGHSGAALRVNGLRNMGDLEQVPVDLLTIADYSHLTALFAPRPALLIYNARDDCCFTAAEALPTVYDPVLPVYRAYGRENDFAFHINEDPGTHNYELDNRIQFYKFISRYFLTPDLRFEDEIPSDEEVLSVDALEVGLPGDNATFKSLALSIAVENAPPRYADSDDAVAALLEVTRYESIESEADRIDEQTIGGMNATAFQFNSGYGPFYGLLWDSGSGSETTAVHISDEPISTSVPALRAMAEAHGRVIAIEPIFLGGIQPGSSLAWQYGMALQACGERILGVQAAQINAVCNWLAGEPGAGTISLHAHGPVSVMATLVAAALAESPIEQVTVQGGFDRIMQPVEDEVDWAKHQPLFCFGLQRVIEFDELRRLLVDTGIKVE